MAIDNFSRAIRDVSTHVSNAKNKAIDSTFAAYVVDVIDDPKRVSPERKETILKFLHNKSAFDYLPGKSVIFAKIDSSRKMKGKKVYYALPFMSTHLSQPINAGEMVWVFNDNGSYYWVSRKVSLSNLEDVNFTSGLRTVSETDSTTTRSNFDIANGIDNTDENTNADFPSLISTADADLVKLMTFFDSHSSKSFVGEPTPNIKPKGNEFLIQGGNNSSIRLGNDNFYGTGNIDITSGLASLFNETRQNSRGYSETNRALYDDRDEAEGNPDLVADEARIFISSKTENTDLKFNLETTNIDEDVINTASPEESSLIASKATNQIMIARENGIVKIIHESGSNITMDSDGNIQISCHPEGKIRFGSSSSLEPFVRGDKMLSEFNKLKTAINTMAATLKSGGTTPGFGGPNPILATAMTKLEVDASSINMEGSLSEKIKGE